MSSNLCNYKNTVITWITGVEPIKRQTRVAYGWFVIGQSVGAGTAYGCSPRCLWHELRRCSCGMRLVVLYRCCTTTIER